MIPFFKVLSPAFALLVSMSLPASAAVCTSPPGSTVTWPNPCSGYEWNVDLSGIGPGDEIAAFAVDVPIGAGPQSIPLFQVFGNQSASSAPSPAAYPAEFALFVNGTPTDWTTVIFSDWLYQSLDGVTLPEGSTQFRVLFDAYSGPVADAPYATLKFGAVVPAIPLPASLWGGVTALLLLTGLRKRRSF